jgi:hypothetical protein
MKTVYGVAHVTGYTSEANIELFFEHSDAINAFEELKENTLMAYLQLNCWSTEILKFAAEKLESDYGIQLDEPYDITWDGFEVYERIYIVELNIN